MPIKNGGDDRTQLPEAPFFFPKVITFSGLLWLMVGGFIAAGAAVRLLAWIEVRQGSAGVQIGRMLMFLVLPLLGLLGIGFFLLGVRTMLGTVKDPMSGAINSFLIGMGFGCLAINRPFAVDAEGLLRVVDFGVPLVLLAAGILAFIGRTEYLAWRASRRPRGPTEWLAASRAEPGPNLLRWTVWGGMIGAASVVAVCLVAGRAVDEDNGESAAASARVAAPIGMLVGGIVGYWLGSRTKGKIKQAEQFASADSPRD
jgi:hypothetical protein